MWHFLSTTSYNNFFSSQTPLNSLSSGQSTEDSWYDVLDQDSLPSTLRNNMSPPPPLPARVGVNSSAGRSPYKYSPHSKMKMSNANALYSLPAVLDGNGVELDYAKSRGDFITGEKVTCLMKAERSHKIRKQLEQKSPRSSLKVNTIIMNYFVLSH